MREKKCRKCRIVLLSETSKGKNLCHHCRNYKDSERHRERQWQKFYQKAGEIRNEWARKMVMINLQRGHKLFLKTGYSGGV